MDFILKLSRHLPDGDPNLPESVLLLYPKARIVLIRSFVPSILSMDIESPNSLSLTIDSQSRRFKKEQENGPEIHLIT